jgi:hypothetical protein
LCVEDDYKVGICINSWLESTNIGRGLAWLLTKLMLNDMDWEKSWSFEDLIEDLYYGLHLWCTCYHLIATIWVNVICSSIELALHILYLLIFHNSSIICQFFNVGNCHSNLVFTISHIIQISCSWVLMLQILGTLSTRAWR